MNIDRECIKFLIAYDKYHLYRRTHKLLKYAMRVYTHTSDGDWYEAKKYYDKFEARIDMHELNGCTDLILPIRNIISSITHIGTQVMIGHNTTHVE